MENRPYYVGTYELIAGIKTGINEYVVVGYDSDSPTPYVTWRGYLKTTGLDCESGNYVSDKQTALNDMLERAGYGIQ